MPGPTRAKNMMYAFGPAPAKTVTKQVTTGIYPSRLRMHPPAGGETGTGPSGGTVMPTGTRKEPVTTVMTAPAPRRAPERPAALFSSGPLGG